MLKLLYRQKIYSFAQTPLLTVRQTQSQGYKSTQILFSCDLSFKSGHSINRFFFWLKTKNSIFFFDRRLQNQSPWIYLHLFARKLMLKVENLKLWWKNVCINCKNNESFPRKQRELFFFLNWIYVLCMSYVFISNNIYL